MQLKSMSSRASLWVVFVLMAFRCKLGYGIVLNHGLYQDPAENYHQPEEPQKEQWTAQPVSSSACPKQCGCKMNDTHHIISVDCSGKGLTMVPDLPKTTVELSLRNNSISRIDCTSFKLLRSLKRLDIGLNNISHLQACLFQFSSISTLNVTENNIKYLDVDLFQGLAYLEVLDVSFNRISFLAARTFADLARLLLLNLSYNKIENISPDAFKGLHSLKTLNFENNLLNNVKSFHKGMFEDLGALEVLKAKGNQGPLDKAICSAQSNLTHLYMDRIDYHRILGAGFRHLINLQVLHLSTVMFINTNVYIPSSICELPMIPFNFFRNMRTERDLELYMSLCSITRIEDDAFLPLHTLVTLDLSVNDELHFGQGKENQGWMESLSKTKITFLDLSFTFDSDSIIVQHYYYDWSFQSLAKTNLKTLLLKYNYAVSIYTSKEFPTTIEKVDLSENCIFFEMLYYFFVTSNLPNFKLRELYANDQYCGKKIARQTLQGTSDTVNIGGSASSSGPYYNTSDRAEKTLVRSESPHRFSVLHGAQNMFMGKTMNSELSSNAETPELATLLHPNVHCPPNFKDPDSNISIICLPTDLEAVYANSAYDPEDLNPGIVPHIRILNNTALRHLELANNHLISLLGPIENVPSLKFLDLSRNQCANLSAHFFKNMFSLETLLLRGNYISRSLAVDVDGVTFSTLTNLKVLDMRENFIGDLSRVAFIHNTKLEILDLSFNQLSEFLPAISTFHNTSFLNLSLNLLLGLSEQTCEDLKLLKSRNTDFTINLLQNRLSFTCDYLPFLYLVISRPDIFFSVEQMKFRHINRTTFYYKELAHRFPALAKECLVQRLFIGILIFFFVFMGTVIICAVIYYKRWKLRYLYYMGHHRMHIGELLVEDATDVEVFVTYDQDDLRWRRFMQQTFLPGLMQWNITYTLGETDFPGGDIMAHMTEAVVGTRKTVVLLSSDIFDDHHREFEVNLAIMREIDTRSLKIVPIFVEEVDLTSYPREIELFLRNQWHRCLRYSDRDDFWDGFIDAVRENN